MNKKRKFAAIAEAGPSPGVPHPILRNGIAVRSEVSSDTETTPKSYPTRLRESTQRQTEDRLEGDPVDLDDLYPTRLPNFRQSSRETNLCSQCRELDLDTLLSRTLSSSGHEPIVLRKLSPVAYWAKHSCVLCNLLYSLPPFKWRKDYSDQEVQLEASSSNEMENKIWGSIDTRILQVRNSFMRHQRHLVLQPEGLNGPVNIINEHITSASFEKVKIWMRLCQEKHTMACSVKNRVPISNFKVIDCNTNTITPGNNHQYLALSYRWGSPVIVDIPEEDPNKLPELLPNTINDAINVTRRLGFRYIWIDRYCIDQTNEEEKMATFGKMDLIYQYAELTIIAAVGNSPTFGLPGVRNYRRKVEHLTACARISRHFLISAPSKPALATLGEWATRGWTYQEVLLSRRRLVFTPDQMYFECYGMFCCELVDFPFEQLHQKDMQGFKSEFCSENLVGIFPRGVGGEQRKYRQGRCTPLGRSAKNGAALYPRRTGRSVS